MLLQTPLLLMFVATLDQIPDIDRLHNLRLIHIRISFCKHHPLGTEWVDRTGQYERKIAGLHCCFSNSPYA